MSSDKFYLPGLNGIRAIAAMAVVFSHINLGLDKFGLPESDALQLASFGVTMFFTLSGFLITHLLLKEKAQTKTVSIKKFYVRRILRIWPLYFFYTGIVLLLVKYNSSFLFVFFFIPNVAFAMQMAMPLLNHYWSLGVEEQFYLFWPWIVKRLSDIKIFLIIFIVAFIGAKMAVKGLLGVGTVYTFLHYTRFGCMAIGALMSWFLFFNKDALRWLKHPVAEIGAWGIFALIAIQRFHVFSIIDHEIAAIATAIIICNQVANPSRLISLENRVMDYLGMISFGLYVYNPLVIDLASRLMPWVTPGQGWLKYAMVYSLIPLLVIGVAHLSYALLEKPFLKWKNSFAVVASSGKKIDLEKTY